MNIENTKYFRINFRKIILRYLITEEFYITKNIIIIYLIRIIVYLL